MKIKANMLLSLMEKKGLTKEGLAREMGVDVSEVEKLLNGEAVIEQTARKFIYYFGADEAQRFVDWEAIGKKNPLDGETGNGSGGEGGDE